MLPIVYQTLQKIRVRTIVPAYIFNLGGPARMVEALLQVSQHCLWNIDLKWLHDFQPPGSQTVHND
jgi:hypothetical protein